MPQPYDEGLNTRHALARIVIEALMLLYGDGALDEEEKRTVGRAADVLQALLLRGDRA